MALNLQQRVSRRVNAPECKNQLAQSSNGLLTLRTLKKLQQSITYCFSSTVFLDFQQIAHPRVQLNELRFLSNEKLHKNDVIH